MVLRYIYDINNLTDSSWFAMLLLCEVMWRGLHFPMRKVRACGWTECSTHVHPMFYTKKAKLHWGCGARSFYPKVDLGGVLPEVKPPMSKRVKYLCIYLWIEGSKELIWTEKENNKNILWHQLLIFTKRRTWKLFNDPILIHFCKFKR